MEFQKSRPFELALAKTSPPFTRKAETGIFRDGIARIGGGRSRCDRIGNGRIELGYRSIEAFGYRRLISRPAIRGSESASALPSSRPGSTRPNTYPAWRSFLRAWRCLRVFRAAERRLRAHRRSSRGVKWASCVHRLPGCNDRRSSARSVDPKRLCRAGIPDRT